MKFLSTLQLSAMSLFLLFAAGVAPAKAQALGTACDWTNGGWIATCAQMANELSPGHRVPAGVHQSAGVMILYNAGCVERGAVFSFHGAWNVGPYGQVASPVGSGVMQRYLAQWPRLVGHLRKVGAFSSSRLVNMSAAEIARFGGPPICR